MTKNERIERILVLANRLNAIVAELTAKKEALLRMIQKSCLICSLKKGR